MAGPNDARSVRVEVFKPLLTVFVDVVVIQEHLDKVETDFLKITYNTKVRECKTDVVSQD